MSDPVTPLTREQPMKLLTVEEVTNYRAVALLGSLGGSGNAQGLSSQDCVIRDLCDSHEALRAETEALRQERNGSVARTPEPPPFTRPRIICLCGSTRFIETFAVKTWELELEGYIVLGCTLLPSWYCPVRDHFAETQGVKEQRDRHHLQKIDLADEVLVLNVGGYIGESTRNEIAYATAHGKPVKYLESLPASSARREGA